MADVKVWTEREAGDWEACVITSYLMGLVYGGLKDFPLGIYTQPEREALEPVKDEPMNFGLSDVATLKRYGLKLRTLSTGTIAAATTRVGVGLVLSGVGFPDTQWSPGFTGYHAVFYLPMTTTSGLLYDPMAPGGSTGKLVTANTIIKWAKGAGPNDAREVKEDEFLGVPDMPLIVQIDSVLPGSYAVFLPGIEYRMWNYDPTTGEKKVFSLKPDASTSAPTTALVTLQGHAPALYFPRLYANGWKDDVYCNSPMPKLVSPPTFTQADIDAAKRQGMAAGEAKSDKEWNEWLIKHP